MDYYIEFTVPGNPVALKRHRTYTKGKGGRPLPFPIQVDPSKNDKADFLAKALQHKPEVPYDQPLSIRLEFCFSRPKVHYRTGKFHDMLKDSAPVWHTKTPDADNLAKFVCDSLNGIFWKDDSCICRLSVIKKYSNVPEVKIIIETINECEI